MPRMIFDRTNSRCTLLLACADAKATPPLMPGNRQVMAEEAVGGEQMIGTLGRESIWAEAKQAPLD